MFIHSLLLLISFVFFGVDGQEKNACNDFSGYIDMENSPDCFHDPDAPLSSPQLIAKYAGEVEIHKTTTADGYILTMFRMPRRNSPKGVVFLQHSLGSNSRVFLGQGKESLGVLLWNEGFDVWLANMRGTQYSQKHVNLSASNLKYWDFSFHEIGVYDIPSQIKLVNQLTTGTTNCNKLIFIGYSLGTTTGLVYASEKSAEAEKYVKLFVFFATSAFFRYGTSPVSLFQDFIPTITRFIRVFGLGAVIPFFPLTIQLGRFVLKIFPFITLIFAVINSAISGGSPLSTDPALFNSELILYADNFSWKLLLHYLQIINLKYRFQWFDYGQNRNMKLYGNSQPPEYPIGNITVPTYLISSANDTLTSMKDTWDIYDILPEAAKKYGKLDVSGLNHGDFIFAKERKTVFLDHLIELVNRVARTC